MCLGEQTRPRWIAVGRRKGWKPGESRQKDCILRGLVIKDERRVMDGRSDNTVSCGGLEISGRRGPDWVMNCFHNT